MSAGLFRLSALCLCTPDILFHHIILVTCDMTTRPAIWSRKVVPIYGRSRPCPAYASRCACAALYKDPQLFATCITQLQFIEPISLTTEREGMWRLWNLLAKSLRSLYECYLKIDRCSGRCFCKTQRSKLVTKYYAGLLYPNEENHLPQ